MAEHILEDGKRWIENLVTLGRALGYQPEAEYDVAQDGEEDAPVDVAWLRSHDDPFPLFLFEVESRPTGQMTYNATKVFSQDSELFEKPLFHFHLVLQGGETSGKVERTQAEYGAFNYRIYANAAKGNGTAAVEDILSQHRRVSDHIDIAALAAALDAGKWPELDVDEIWSHAEDCGFLVAWERHYADLAIDDPAFLPRLARRLEHELDGVYVDTADHPTALGRHCAPVLHASILALLRPDMAGRCLESCTAWQGAAGKERVAPVFGDHGREDLVFALAPALWAAIPAAIPGEAATAWALDQLALTLHNAGQPVELALSGLSAAWMLHVARAGGDPHREAFASAVRHIDDEGGIAAEIWSAPSGLGGTMDHFDDWAARLSHEAEPAPTWEDVGAPPAGNSANHSALLASLLAVLIGREGALDGAVVLAALWASPAEAPVATAAAPPTGT